MSVIEFAEKRMMEEEKAGEEKNVLYWSAYLDGARAQKKEVESKRDRETINPYENTWAIEHGYL